MDLFPLKLPAPPAMEADGGARLRRALISLVGRSGLDGVSPHPVHGQGQGEGEQSLRHALFSTAFLRHSILFTLLAFASFLLAACPTTAGVRGKILRCSWPLNRAGTADP